MKAKKLICLATVAVMAASMAAVFAGCGEDKVSVEWMTSAREVMKTDSVKKGSKVEDWTPTADQTPDGKVFAGWYEEASYATKFNFDTEIKEDTRIYANWRNAQTAADMRIWYTFGSGAGTLAANNWTFATEPEKDADGVPVVDENGNATFSKIEGYEASYLTKKDNVNEFTIELTLYQNDEFFFVANGFDKTAWTGDAGFSRAGFGSIVGAEIEGLAGVVKDANNETVFSGKKGMDDVPYKWNIKVEKSGIYEFTLTTFPDDDETFNTISWTRKGDAPEIKETHKMMFLGGHNGWNGAALDENGEAKDEKDLLTKKSDGTFIGFVTVTKDTELKLYNIVNKGWFGDAENGGENFKITEGTWCFTYNPTNDEIKYEKCDYYVVGTFVNEKGENVNFENNMDFDVNIKLTTADDGATYTCTVEIKDVSKVSGYEWMQNDKPGAVAAIQVIFGTTIGQKDWYGNNGNVFIMEAGTYTVTLNMSSKTITAEKQ